MVYDDETLQVKSDQRKLKNKNVNMQGFENRLKGFSATVDCICKGLRMQLGGN